ncbi:hypothetical protein BDFG_04265 [Blastomyces dermatitidis ATCC 26199]|nr:hypothetical protein BDFG_04265 [Blastomyces dermatitidis ATCC 26199]
MAMMRVFGDELSCWDWRYGMRKVVYHGIYFSTYLTILAPLIEELCLIFHSDLGAELPKGRDAEENKKLAQARVGHKETAIGFGCNRSDPHNVLNPIICGIVNATIAAKTQRRTNEWGEKSRPKGSVSQARIYPRREVRYHQTPELVCTLLLRTWIEDEGGEDVDSDPAHCLNFVSMSGF